MDFLLRKDAPINETEWAELDDAVHQVVRRQLIGRRFLKLYGPLGAEVEVIPTDRSPGYDLGQVDMVGPDDDPVALAGRIYQKLPMLHKDFILFWRDLESSARRGLPMDWSMAEAAASFVARAEDQLILHGDSTLHIEGLTTVAGRHVLETRGWIEAQSGYRDVVTAINHLASAGFYPPYTVIVGTEGYAAWHRLFGNSGVLEIDQIRKLVEGGVFVTPQMPNDTLLVVAASPENLDLAIGLDTTVAFLESSSMNHAFRVLETLTIRIKRSGAICHFVASTPS
ncbi:MAG: bacteriocin family protein [Firmicutes bacterium]|nr:bacteriocin family protein [Bacillota bacterium]